MPTHVSLVPELGLKLHFGLVLPNISIGWLPLPFPLFDLVRSTTTNEKKRTKTLSKPPRNVMGTYLWRPRASGWSKCNTTCKLSQPWYHLSELNRLKWLINNRHCSSAGLMWWLSPWTSGSAGSKTTPPAPSIVYVAHPAVSNKCTYRKYIGIARVWNLLSQRYIRLRMNWYCEAESKSAIITNQAQLAKWMLSWTKWIRSTEEECHYSNSH